MKKLLFVMVVGFGAAMFVKSGEVTATPDRQIQVAGYRVPLPDAVQNSPLVGMLIGQLPETSATAGGSSGAPARPVLPIVSSASGSFNANAPVGANGSRGGMATGADGFAAAAKAIRGSQ